MNLGGARCDLGLDYVPKGARLRVYGKGPEMTCIIWSARPKVKGKVVEDAEDGVHLGSRRRARRGRRRETAS